MGRKKKRGIKRRGERGGGRGGVEGEMVDERQDGEEKEEDAVWFSIPRQSLAAFHQLRVGQEPALDQRLRRCRLAYIWVMCSLNGCQVSLPKADLLLWRLGYSMSILWTIRQEKDPGQSRALCCLSPGFPQRSQARRNGRCKNQGIL